MSSCRLPRSWARAILPHMKGLAVVFAFTLVACAGELAMLGDRGPPDNGTDVPEVVAACIDIPQPGAEPFMSGLDLGPVVAGTLGGWDPTGRWFLTGVRVGGASSYRFDLEGGALIVDRDRDNPATFDDSMIFQRARLPFNGQTYTIVKRVSNRGRDGTARAERVVCDGDNCRVCTARLERATWNEPSESERMSLVGEIGGDWPPSFTVNVRVHGNYAYVVRFDGLYIVDISNLSAPTL